MAAQKTSARYAAACKLGARLQHYRVKKGMTQTELAKAIGVTRATVTNWECGNGTLTMTLKYFLLAAAVLEINVSALMRGIEVTK